MTISSTRAGVFVENVRRGGPADRAGLKYGQKILEVNGETVATLQDASIKIQVSGNRFQLLVIEPRSYLDKVLVFLESQFNNYLAQATPYKQYVARVALRLPLILFAHLWFLLCPISDNTIVDMLLCLLRYLGSTLLLACWRSPVKKLLNIYRCLAVDMFIAFLMETVYWTFQGACHDAWLSWGEDTWWTPVMVTFVLQVAHLRYLFKKHKIYEDLRLIIGFLFIPYMFCSLGITVYAHPDIHYWLSKGIFCGCFTVDLYHIYGHFKLSDIPISLVAQEFLILFGVAYNNQTGDFEFRASPCPFFGRDLLALFGVVYYVCCGVFDLLFMYGAAHVFSLSYMSSILGRWCTTFVIISALGALLAVISNSAAAVYLKLIKGEWNFYELMYSLSGYEVTVGMLAFCLEAGILTVYEEKRILNMNGVLFIVAWKIFSQAWNLTESHLLAVINSGDQNRWLNTARVLLASLVLLTVPTLLTVHVASKMGVDTWLMLNLSGNIIMLTRAAMVFVEIGLVACTWYVDEGLWRLEDAIFLLRISKTGVTVLCCIVESYYRFNAPFLDTWWVLRLIIIIGIIFAVTFTLCEREWVTIQERRQMVARVSRLADATPEEIADHDDDCSICFSEMTSAKKLPCSHIFHGLCLRKWFQVRLVCPFCNIDVFNWN